MASRRPSSSGSEAASGIWVRADQKCDDRSPRLVSAILRPEAGHVRTPHLLGKFLIGAQDEGCRLRFPVSRAGPESRKLRERSLATTVSATTISFRRRAFRTLP